MGFIKPLLKRSHHVLVSDEGDICIGEIPGRSKIIPQPPPWVPVVLALLDGEHTVPRLLKQVAAQGLEVAADEVIAFIDALMGFGLVEENAWSSALLGAEERERYDRQILQFALVDQQRVDNAAIYQERLKRARVLVLGMGGWGTWCCLQLARSGVGTLRIVDGDAVETSNLNRQVLYGAGDVGRSKVAAAADSLRMHNPHVRVEGVAEFADADPQQLGVLLDQVDLVVLAWASLGYYRQYTVERVLHRLAAAQCIPVLELGGDPLDIAVGPLYLHDGSHPDFEQLRVPAQQRFYSQEPLLRSFQQARLRNAFCNGNRTVNAWQSAPSLAVMAGLAADQVVKLLTGYDHCNLVGKRLHFSLQTYQFREEVVFACP